MSNSYLEDKLRYNMYKLALDNISETLCRGAKTGSKRTTGWNKLLSLYN